MADWQASAQSLFSCTVRRVFQRAPSFIAQVVEWQTRMLEVHVPQGVRVQVPA
jgi:hypothetical protein